ncbi:hypothetical protein CXX93_19200 (plasmid) [Gordonia sp. YC-JH1]|nr:DUF4192 family protein [Gordonia sp. YC-JH1]AUH70548.1 hypothetical protein CXX93_19200 [Gordonia sp. YC-JH1]
MAIKISTDTDIVTSAAGVIGFAPRESIVTIMLTNDQQMAFTARHDIADNKLHNVGAVGESLDAQSAIVVIVSEELDAADVEQLAAQATTVYAAHGIAVVRRLHAPVIQYGARWTNLDTKDTGLVDDPDASTAGLYSRLTGGAPTDSRETLVADIERTVAEYTGDDYARITASRALDELSTVITHGTPTEVAPDELAKSLATYSRMEGSATQSFVWPSANVAPPPRPSSSWPGTSEDRTAHTCSPQQPLRSTSPATEVKPECSLTQPEPPQTVTCSASA